MCVRDRAVVQIDGLLAYGIGEIENPQGYVALWTQTGTAEFKNIEIKQLALPEPSPGEGVFRPGEGVELPRVLHEVFPKYTSAAMAARIQGTVVVTAVVQPDGRVGDVVVLRSLDTKFGLDRQAVEVAKAWRFIPGKLNGRAVPVVVTIELTFTLK